MLIPVIDLCTTRSKVILVKFLEHHGFVIDQNRRNIFLTVRQLAIRVSREGGNCVPVYPERVKSLIEKE
jgi:hypothetical protein